MEAENNKLILKWKSQSAKHLMQKLADFGGKAKIIPPRQYQVGSV